jgi:hypothetical protein
MVVQMGHTFSLKLRERYTNLCKQFTEGTVYQYVQTVY